MASYSLSRTQSSATGTSSDDTFIPYQETSVWVVSINGGDGTDTVSIGTSSGQFSISTSSSTGVTTVTSASGKVLQLSNIEKLAFSNKTFSLSSAAGDTTAPTVSSFSPGDGASSVAVNSNIVVTFSETIQLGTGNIVLKKADGTVVETYNAASSSNLSVSGSTLTINPSSDLSNSTNYYLTFAAGTIKDTTGNNYAGTTTYDFTTAAPSDTTAPTVASATPSDGATGVAVSDNLVLTFDESIQLGTGTIVLKTVAGKVVQTFKLGSGSDITVSGDTLTINPKKDLLYGTGYSITISAGAIKDAVGNSSAEITQTFTTTDTLTTTASSYTLKTTPNKLAFSGTGDFVGTGNKISNVITGGAGNDTLYGGLGSDTLTGGDGSDRFVFTTKLGAANVDMVADFVSGTDQLGLKASIFGKLKGDTDLSDNFVSGAVALDANDYLVFDSATDTLYYDVDGSGTKKSAVAVAIIGSGAELTVADLVLV